MRAAPAMSTLTSHSPPTESVVACVRLLAKYGALLVLILVPALAQAGPGSALHNTVYDGIGYSMARGAQAPNFLPVAAKSVAPPIPRFAPVQFPSAKAAPAPKSKIAGNVTALYGTVTVTRNGVTKPLTVGDQLRVGDIITTGSKGAVTFLDTNVHHTFAISESSKVTVNKKYYESELGPPVNPVWNVLQGFFVKVTCMIGNECKFPQTEGPVDGDGIRGMNRVPRMPKLATVADQIQTGDTLATGFTGYLPVSFSDGSTMPFAQASKLTINKSVYDQTHPEPSNAGYAWLRGDFERVAYQSGSDKNIPIETPVGSAVIRGTRFIIHYDAKARTMDIELMAGSAAVNPKRSSTVRKFAAPVHILCTATSVTGSPLTRKQYEATESALFPR